MSQIWKLPFKWKLLILVFMAIVAIATYNTLKWVTLGAVVIMVIVAVFSLKEKLKL